MAPNDSADGAFVPCLLSAAALSSDAERVSSMLQHTKSFQDRGVLAKATKRSKRVLATSRNKNNMEQYSGPLEDLDLM